MGAKNVVGLDFSKEILHAAKENCNNFSNISFIHGDAHNIPYPNETFDIVISACSYSSFTRNSYIFT